MRTRSLRALIHAEAVALLLALVVGCLATPTPTPPANPITPTSTPTAGAVTARPPDSPTPTGTLTPGTRGKAQRLVGYFFGSDRANHVSDIAAAQLTDVIYAFADVSSTGECASIDAAADQINLPQLRQLKQQYPALKTLISIGGYSHSTYFSSAAMTAASRRHFVQTCVQFMKQNGLDGIDVDWELPVSGGKAGNQHSPQDKQNFTALLAEFRSQLDTLGASDNEHYLLTIAGPAGPSEYANIELGVIPQYLDWLNLETYAFATANSPMTNFNAPLYPSSSDPDPNPQKRRYDNGAAAVRAYLAAGVPANKILLGVPFYGRGWQGVPNINNGLYQPDTGAATDAAVPKGTWVDGAITFSNLNKYYLGTYSRYWQDEVQEPWLYNPQTGIMITYEDPQSLGAKADYVTAQGLGGVMIWHVSADDSQHELLNVLYAHLFPSRR